MSTIQSPGPAQLLQARLGMLAPELYRYYQKLRASIEARHLVAACQRSEVAFSEGLHELESLLLQEVYRDHGVDDGLEVGFEGFTISLMRTEDEREFWMASLQGAGVAVARLEAISAWPQIAYDRMALERGVQRMRMHPELVLAELDVLAAQTGQVDTLLPFKKAQQRLMTEERGSDDLSQAIQFALYPTTTMEGRESYGAPEIGLRFCGVHTREEEYATSLDAEVPDEEIVMLMQVGRRQDGPVRYRATSAWEDQIHTAEAATEILARRAAGLASLIARGGYH